MEFSRSLYKNGVDFAALALQSPEFAKHLKSNGQLDFNNPASVRALTISLLQQDFRLKIELPEDRLCPPVPNRLNYIIWLQDLLDSTAGTIKEGYDTNREVFGLDIGTGCCSIYPLLGCRLRPQWKFLATEIDENNARTAEQNVKLNKLESRVQIVRTDPKDSLFPLNKFGQKRIDFTICNPPFYASHEEMTQSAEFKSEKPSQTCTGADMEMVTPGGEVAFVTRMIEESMQLRTQVQWYTSMLGKFGSVTVLVETLMKNNNRNYAVTELVQGKTKRWALAWSWGDRHPKTSVARGIPGFPKHLLPFPGDYTFTLSPETSIDTASATLNGELDSLSWYWHWDQNLSAGVGFTSENVWSRQARRKMKLAGQEGMQITTVPEEVALGVRVQVKLMHGQTPEANGEVQVLIRWIQGTDSVLFESFCGMLKRKMEA
ncbi:uncharacterized protein N7498_010345 [Penicillium cinerascens]|uniref:U6 small nuclear RNA (adenine-(43)-N(6))-methyltransferase n=1 Tax=Penicillium cinerascens TaxID=70096 RepID=A0A9W9J6R7_9EURO|nr:uncharacterized protein N7498_010345 [Penicillium cinerascens]KAJ5191360.1 hypothetical protein N7498_010345 [Penicillium cinerascens]